MRASILHILRICALMAYMALWSCDVHEFPGEADTDTAGGEIWLHFDNRDMPLLTTVETGSGRMTRGETAGEPLARFTIAGYPLDEAASRTMSRTAAFYITITDHASTATDSRRIDARLPQGRYRLVIWADYSDENGSDLYYKAGDLSRISLTDPCDTPLREAFRGELDIEKDASGTLYDPTTGKQASLMTVEMHRPMARFVFVTTDLMEFIQQNRGKDDETAGNGPVLDDYRVRMRYTTYMPDVYNALTDKPVDSALGAYFEGRVNMIDEHTGELGGNFVFVNGSETSVQVAMDIYRRSDNRLIATVDGIMVPLKRNHLTIVRGRFLTMPAGTGPAIDPGYDGDFDIEIR